MKPYAQKIQDLELIYETDFKKGLTTDKVNKRFEKYGKNILPEKYKFSYFKIFFRQFQSPLIYILFIASALIFLIGERLDAFITLGVLFFNAILGTIQEGRTRILEGLKKLLKTEAIVIRNGKHEIIEDKDLVVGDIIILKEGEKIPADARIIEAINLTVDESSLTGESIKVNKKEYTFTKDVPIHDQINMVFQGTYVLSGYTKALVTATGSYTEIGKIQKTTESIFRTLPLYKEINRLSKFIIIFVLFTCISLFFIGMLSGTRTFTDLFVTLTALFICVIPEGLPIVLTVVLVSGAYRLAKQKVLVKKLQAVEALGRINIIMIDKTGTLTRNELMVNKIYCDNKIYDISGKGYFTEGSISFEGQNLKKTDLSKNLILLSQAANLLNRSEIKYDSESQLFKIKGDPIDSSMYIFAQKIFSIDPTLEQEKYTLVHDIPFDYEKRYHVAFYKNNNENIVFMVGSPEIILQHCINSTEDTKKVLQQFLEEGLRIIAIASKIIEEKKEQNLEEELDNLKLIGLLAIEDSIRENVDKYVEEAQKSGFRIILITGDHKKTASYVAKKVGISNPENVIEGFEFEKLSRNEKIQILKEANVIARATPHNKFEIVELFQSQGLFVAMTGDGVNDAPSLAAADVGIAMGTIGTEVAKQASDVVLLEDSFINIVNAVEQGRHIFSTLRRVILYFFSTNASEVLLILFSIMLNLPLPLFAAQILWINLVTDGFLDAALSAEPIEKETVLTKWEEMKNGLINRSLLQKVLFMAIPIAAGSLFMFYRYLPYGITKARTLTLITLAMFEWFNAWNCRSEYKSIFKLGFFKNKWLIATTSFVLLLQFLVVYNPAMQYIFKTESINILEWIEIVLISSSIIVIEELRKYFVNNKID